MKNKYLVGYCDNCGKITKQEVVKCEDSTGERLLFGIFTLGFSEALGHSYRCECTKCGEINKIDT